jgi:hypothetical protein
LPLGEHTFVWLPQLMPHHTKDKGDLGVAKAHADLVSQGFMVLFPTTEHAPFDLVAYRDATFVRVQVKYRTAKSGVVEIRMQSTWSDIHGIHTSPIEKDQIDVFCVYCPDSDACYYFDPAAHRQSVTIRLTAARNNQSSRVNSALLRTVPAASGFGAPSQACLCEQLSLLCGNT